MVSIGTIVKTEEKVVEYNGKSTQRAKKIKELEYLSGLVSTGDEVPVVMMETKTVAKYRVRVPLLHGESGQPSAVPDSQLPEATFCSLPGTENTKLSDGDQVYVAVVDFDFGKITILGFVANDQANRNDGASLKRVQELQMADNGIANFNKNITISDGKDIVTWKNLSTLAGWDKKLSEWTWGVEQGGTGVSIKGTLEDMEAAKKTARDNLGVYSMKIVSSSAFEKIQQRSLYEKNTIYYIYDEEDTT